VATPKLTSMAEESKATKVEFGIATGMLFYAKGSF
jgi:hypothetical protein